MNVAFDVKFSYFCKAKACLNSLNACTSLKFNIPASCQYWTNVGGKTKEESSGEPDPFAGSQRVYAGGAGDGFERRGR